MFYFTLQRESRSPIQIKLLFQGALYSEILKPHSNNKKQELVMLSFSMIGSFVEGGVEAAIGRRS